MSPPKPLFKKKKPKSAAARKPRHEDPAADQDLGHGLGVKKHLKPTRHQKGSSPANKSLPTSSFADRGPQKHHGSHQERPRLPGKFNEGDIIAGEDMDSDEEPKYVPRISEDIEKHLSKRQTLNELVHEYDDNDDNEDAEDDHYATISPGDRHKDDNLDLNSDDELVNNERFELLGLHPPSHVMSVDDEKYDTQIGDSDDSADQGGAYVGSLTATTHPGASLKHVVPQTTDEEIATLGRMVQEFTQGLADLKRTRQELDSQLGELRRREEQALGLLKSL